MFRGILVFILISAPALALAHSGASLDKYGCHKDKRQGGYHCHKGTLNGYTFASQTEMLKELHRRERQDEARRKSSPWESKN